MTDTRMESSLDEAFRIANEAMNTASDELERYTASGLHDADRVIELISAVAAAQRDATDAYNALQQSRAAWHG